MSVHVPGVYVFSTAFLFCFDFSVALATSFQSVRDAEFVFLFCTIHSSGETHEKMVCKNITASPCSEQVRVDHHNCYCRFTPEIASRVIGKAQSS